MNGTVSIERDASGVVTLRLDNPAHRNALNGGMIVALTEAFGKLAHDPGCRVIVLRGAGGIFCAGREITDLQALQQAGIDEISAAYDDLNVLFDLVYHCPRPVVAVMERYALGAGIMLAGLADIAIAEESCAIGYPELRLGIPPSQAAVQLIRGVNRKAAVDLILTARIIRAPEALRLGLISRAVPADALEAEAGGVIATLSGWNPDAVARTKQVIWKTEDVDYRTAMAVGADLISIGVAARAAHDGVAAFVEKRAAARPGVAR